MTIKARIKELESSAEAERLLRSCTCARPIVIEGEPTRARQQQINALEPCPVHPVVVVVEVGRAPVRDIEVQEAFELEN